MADLFDLTYKLAREHLYPYAKLQNHRMEEARHHKKINAALEALDRGDVDRMMFFLPPRHGKSTLCSQFFPAWYLGRHPDHYVISASYSQGLADDFGRQVRNLLQDPLHTRIFPECRLADDSQAMQRFFTTAGGAYFAVGRGGPITGRGAHLLIIDDPIRDREEANSELVRKGLHQWYSDVAYTRLMPGGKIVIIQTRWHEDDLAGWLLAEQPDEKWHVLSMPAIAEEDSDFRKEGEPLWPEHFPLDTLERIRRAIGTSSWLCLYQQRVGAAEGTMFKRHWLDPEPPYRPTSAFREVKDPKNLNLYITVDPASSKKKTSDWTVMWVVGLSSDRKRYALDVVRGRWSLTERGDNLFRLHRKYGGHILGVGYEEYGLQADISYIHERMVRENYSFHIFPLGGGVSKYERIQRLAPEFEFGRFFLPPEIWGMDDQGYRNDLIRRFVDEEYLTFPASRHDDMLDSLSRIMDPNFPTTFPISREEIEYMNSQRPCSGTWMSA